MSLILALLAGSFLAEAGPPPGPVPDEVLVKVGRSVLVPLPMKVQRIAVEDPSVAALELLPRGALRITGKRIGQTRVVGRYEGQIPILIRVKVLPGAAVAPPKGVRRARDLD